MLGGTVGVGWRRELSRALLADPGRVGFVEVVAESCHSIWPVVPHGVKLSLGSAEGIDDDRARELGRLARAPRAARVGARLARSRAGHLAVTLAPRAPILLREHVERAPRETIALAAGDVLVASNHRMVHGRTAFDARSGRELLRLLVWLERPLAAPAALFSCAREVAPALARPDVLLRTKAVAALLRGVPPAKIARDLGITEAALYALRERALGELTSA